MRITTDQIAAKCHVSRSTVSRVLNDFPHVDETTRSVVWQAAQELGYPLPRRKDAAHISRSVLVLARREFELDQRQVDSNGLGFERMVTLALQSVFERDEIATRLERLIMEPRQAQHYAHDLGVAGLVLLGGIINHDFVQELLTLRFPFVVVGAHMLPLQVNCVTADFSGGMEAVVSHLIERGRRRIALVNGPPTTTTSAEKYRGFRTALALHDLPYSPGQVVSANFGADGGFPQTLQILEAFPELDAIAYADDYMAMRGLRAIKASGRRVPEDIAVTGFYNYEIASFAEPRLTTVHVDMHRMGVIAAQRLTMLLQDTGLDHWLISVPTRLIVNEST